MVTYNIANGISNTTKDNQPINKDVKNLKKYKSSSENDINILLINDMILDYFEKEHKKRLDNKESDIDILINLGFYYISTFKILSEYENILDKANIFNISNGSMNIFKNKRKKILINNYLKICKDYPELYNIIQPFKKDEIKDNKIDNNEDNSNIYSDSYFKDSLRINVNKRFIYLKQSNFNNTLLKFQCKKVKVTNDVIEFVRKRLEELDVTNITKRIIYRILKEKKLSKYYKDVYYVYSIITKISPPNLVEYEKKLFYYFDLFIDAYCSLIKGKNIPKEDYILWKLLEIIGYDCKKEDFILPRDIKLREYDEIWKKVCKKNKWIFSKSV